MIEINVVTSYQRPHLLAFAWLSTRRNRSTRKPGDHKTPHVPTSGIEPGFTTEPAGQLWMWCFAGLVESLYLLVRFYDFTSSPGRLNVSSFSSIIIIVVVNWDKFSIRDSLIRIVNAMQSRGLYAWHWALFYEKCQKSLTDALRLKYDIARVFLYDSRVNLPVYCY